MNSNILLGGGISLGGAAGSSGKLLCTATDSSGAQPLIHFNEVTFAFDTVEQATPVYDPGTAVFTIPTSGLYLLQLSGGAPSMSDFLSSYIVVRRNGDAVAYLPEFALRAGDITVNGMTVFEASAGDAITVATMVNAPTSLGGTMFAGSFIKLFSL